MCGWVGRCVCVCVNCLNMMSCLLQKCSIEKVSIRLIYRLSVVHGDLWSHDSSMTQGCGGVLSVPGAPHDLYDGNPLPPSINHLFSTNQMSGLLEPQLGDRKGTHPQGPSRNSLLGGGRYMDFLELPGVPSLVNKLPKPSPRLEQTTM